jgi:NADH dehydrogenase
VKVFITGATGFVGQEVLRHLVAAHHSIRILARNDTSLLARNLQSRYHLEVHRGDVTQPATLSGALVGVEAVLHLVGIISEARESTFEHVHVHGTQNMLTAARESGVRRFIQMSALGTRPNAASRYHQTKWAAEEEVRQSGLDYTIFRPSLIFGAEDHFVNQFAGFSRYSPVLPVMGKGQARFQPVAVQVVGSAFAKSLNLPAAVGQTFDLCGPETLTFEEMLNQILGTLGRKRAKVRLSLGLARIQAALLEWVFPKLLNRAPPLNRDQLLMLQEDNVGNGAPADDLFGLEQTRFREGIAAYLGKYASRPAPDREVQLR